MHLFTLIVALMPLVSFALASPARLEVPHDRQELTVVYHRANSNITVEALSSGALVGRACSATLSTGSFAKIPIIFDVDDRGSGNLTVGPSAHWIHEDVEYSGGIICGRMYNDVEAAVSCTVTVPAELPMPPLSGLDVTECTTNDARYLSKTLNAVTNALPGPANINNTMVIPIRHRQIPPICTSNGDTKRWACGDPHQNFYHRQLSGRTNCGTQPSCSEVYHGDGVSVSYTSDHQHVEKWISGGFHVQEKWKTDTSYVCTANPGETVCIWYKFAHTAYMVQNEYQSTCGWSYTTHPFVLYSPNQDNVNGGRYCVIGPCRHEGDWWWDYSGAAGDDAGSNGC